MASNESESIGDVMFRGCLTGIVAVAFVPGIAAVGCVVHGYVLSCLWGWFVVPVFGLPGLTVPAAAGVWMTVRHFGSHCYIKSEYTLSVFMVAFMDLVLGPAVALAVGYSLHWLVQAGYLSLAAGVTP